MPSTDCADRPGLLIGCFAPMLCLPPTRSWAGRTRRRPGDWAPTQARSATAEALFVRGFFPRCSEVRPRRIGRKRSSCFRLRMSLSRSWRHERFGNVWTRGTGDGAGGGVAHRMRRQVGGGVLIFRRFVS